MSIVPPGCAIGNQSSMQTATRAAEDFSSAQGVEFIVAQLGVEAAAD
jgi:hypothetical protein